MDQIKLKNKFTFFMHIPGFILSNLSGHIIPKQNIVFIIHYDSEKDFWL